MLKKNIANQKWRAYAFNRTTNAPALGEAANITAKLSKDWAAAAALATPNPTETEDGYYLFTLTQAESNFDNGDLFPECSTANIQVIGTPASQSTWTPDIAGVKAKTDTLPAAPASETTLNAVGVIATEIQAKTDLIPAVPANEATSTAIKLKTDTLPAAPASEVTLAAGIASLAAAIALTASEATTQAGFTTVVSFLNQIVNWINTEVADIKAKTDNLPATPANEATLTALVKLCNADVAIDTSTVPWALVFLENGTGGVGVGTELLRQPLKDVAGANVVASDQIIGRAGL